MAFASTRRRANSAVKISHDQLSACWMALAERSISAQRQFKALHRRVGPHVCAALAFDERHLAEHHAGSGRVDTAVTLFVPATNSVRRFPVNLERSSCELIFKEMEMNVKTVSGASMAAAAIALVLSGAAPAPALAKKMSKSVHCSGINSCKEPAPARLRTTPARA